MKLVEFAQLQRLFEAIALGPNYSYHILDFGSRRFALEVKYDKLRFWDHNASLVLVLLIGLLGNDFFGERLRRLVLYHQ